MNLMEMIDVTVGSLRAPDHVVLEGIHWAVVPGDFWMIGGLSGSGKTDFLFVAAGILAPRRGVYRLFGQELTGGFSQAQLAERLRVGVVFDGGQLLTHLTLAENIALPVRYHRNCYYAECQERIEALMAFTGLQGKGGQRPGEVGRQWRHRAGLARALALGPEVLLLDNPLSGQDPSHARWWLDRLGELAAGHPVTEGRPLTVVATGTDLAPWQGVARQFAVLKRGRLVAGAPAPDPADTIANLHRELTSMEESGP